ncbi:MAG: DUF177 domain-containing protein [Methylibium sp.]|uniref:YceD family protein n=1 Tax=Methylibium sp. TaxID=2067992 RepID=UPI0017D5AAF0|nr:DUF177 domain-containing protein [Methylibium sp.]MBA2722579.1 DUF177 domain-containing protein [Methylibium sp.]MBA3590353.1 DUF177 domain-containing protein [Methylibium sp.]
MKSREFDPLRLDVAALAEQGASLDGSWPLASLPRLAASAHADSLPKADDAVTWSVRGERRARVGAPAEIWLHLQGRACLELECQRCLGPVVAALEIDRALRFVPGEDQAAALDADSDDDVLALNRWLDLRELVEDELLLALPLVPRHEACPQPLPLPGESVLPDGQAEPPHPFAVLQALKESGDKH